MATKNLLHHAAHNRIYRAIRAGKIEPPYYMNCADCGYSPCEYHHPDYSDMMLVIPLCRACHKRRHRQEAKSGRKATGQKTP